MNRIQTSADPIRVIKVWLVLSAKDRLSFELHEWQYLLYSGLEDIRTRWISEENLKRMDEKSGEILKRLEGFRILDGRYQLPGEDVLAGELGEGGGVSE